MQSLQESLDSGVERFCVLQNRSSDVWIDFADAATWQVSR